MKKAIIIVVISVIAILSIVGIVYIKNIKEKENEELDKHLILLTYETFKEKIENKDDFILIITKTDCPHCEEFKPVFKKILKDYDLYAYEVQHDTFVEPAEEGFLKSVATISGTPTIVFIKNGEEENTLNRIVGNRSRSFTIEKLKAFGYIK